MYGALVFYFPYLYSTFSTPIPPYSGAAHSSQLSYQSLPCSSILICKLITLFNNFNNNYNYYMIYNIIKLLIKKEEYSPRHTDQTVVNSLNRVPQGNFYLILFLIWLLQWFPEALSDCSYFHYPINPFFKITFSINLRKQEP